MFAFVFRGYLYKGSYDVQPSYSFVLCCFLKDYTKEQYLICICVNYNAIKMDLPLHGLNVAYLLCIDKTFIIHFCIFNNIFISNLEKFLNPST